MSVRSYVRLRGENAGRDPIQSMNLYNAGRDDDQKHVADVVNVANGKDVKIVAGVAFVVQSDYSHHRCTV